MNEFYIEQMMYDANVTESSINAEQFAHETDNLQDENDGDAELSDAIDRVMNAK